MKLELVIIAALGAAVIVFAVFTERSKEPTRVSPARTSRRLESDWSWVETYPRFGRFERNESLDPIRARPAGRRSERRISSR
jgi:hypothetical protein